LDAIRMISLLFSQARACMEKMAALMVKVEDYLR